MLQDNLSTIGGWTGYHVASVTRKRSHTAIELDRNVSGAGVCPRCGAESNVVHERVRREVRDLPAFGQPVKLSLERCRISCPRCGPVVEELPWLARNRRNTIRLERFVVELCSRMPIRDVSHITGLSWDTVKRIDKAHLQSTVGAAPTTGARIIGMDEFAIQRGHRYATVIVDLETGKLLWVGRDRSRLAIRPFFASLGPEECQRIEAVAMDMSAAYSNEVVQWCPQAKIVYDLFHVVAKYGREVIDRVRVDQANRLRHDKKARQVVKGSRWLLLRSPENVHRQQDQIRLSELLAANKSIAKAYIMRDELKQVWRATSTHEATDRWNAWYRKAVYSQIKPLVKFAKALKKFLHGIISHAVYSIHTSIIEGINNKIKVIKRRAYGYRDDEYFFLKLKAAFPGLCG